MQILSQVSVSVSLQFLCKYANVYFITGLGPMFENSSPLSRQCLGVKEGPGNLACFGGLGGTTLGLDAQRGNSYFPRLTPLDWGLANRPRYLGSPDQDLTAECHRVSRGARHLPQSLLSRLLHICWWRPILLIFPWGFTP